MQPILEQLTALDEARFAAIYEALAQQGFGPLDGELAKLLKFRPQAMRKLPMQQRARKAKQLVESRRNAELAYDLLGSYLMATDRALITDFLDLTGVPHDEGIIEDSEETRPDPAKLGEAVTKLDGDHAPDDVTLYLAVALQTWPEHQELDALWRKRAGVRASTKGA